MKYSCVVSALLFAFLLVGGAAPSSWAAQVPQIVRDSGGMPRCLSAPRLTPVLLKWAEKEKYSRTITVIPLTRHVVDLAIRGGKREIRISCSDWQTYNNAIPEMYGKSLPENATEVAEYSITEEVKAELAQVRRGADEFHLEKTGAEYFTAHPIQEFDTSVNRELTARFGVGFVSQIFKAWVESKPQNKKFKEEVLEALKTSGLPAVGSLSSHFENTVVIRVPGLGHETRSSQRFEVFTDQLKLLGVPIVKVKSGSMDPVEKNVAITREYFENILKTGKNVIVLAQSKGGTEAVEALAQLTSKLEGPNREPGYGRVLAYIGMSGVYDSSFLIEWAGGIPQWWFVKGKLRKSLKDDGADVPTLDGFLDLREDPMQLYRQRVVSLGLPQSTVYLSVVGAIEGDGLAGDASVRQVQDDLIRAQLKDFGSNDGYIEFPGTLLPETWVPKSFAIVVNGSHALVDGDFAELFLKDPDQDRQVASALVSTLLKYVQR